MANLNVYTVHGVIAAIGHKAPDHLSPVTLLRKHTYTPGQLPQAYVNQIVTQLNVEAQRHYIVSNVINHLSDKDQMRVLQTLVNQAPPR